MLDKNVDPTLSVPLPEVSLKMPDAWNTLILNIAGQDFQVRLSMPQFRKSLWREALLSKHIPALVQFMLLHDQRWTSLPYRGPDSIRAFLQMLPIKY